MSGAPRLVVIGNGMAGVRCVEEILSLAPDAYRITIIGNEPHPNYNRILLSKVLQGDTSIADITINGFDWYRERGIRLVTGETVVRIDAQSRRVVAESGMTVEYDELIVATGSSAFRPPLPGIDKQGVTAFRSIRDCETMMEAATAYKRAAVIGGGLLGLEAARGLLNLGMEVDVVHNAPHLMNRQLDETAADLLKRELRGQGMRFWMNKRTERITGWKRADGLLFSDGSKLSADLIVLAVGISPNVGVAAASGIRTNRAIVVDDYLRTSAPNVYAVGECAEHDGIVYGLVAPLYEQGKVLARKLTGHPTPPYQGSVPYAMLKVSGVDVFSAGDIRGDGVETAVQHYDGIAGTYRKVTMREGRVAGAVLYGDSSEGMKLLDLLKKQASVDALRESAGTGAAGTGGASEAAAEMADHATVCSCNGVSKGAIVEAIGSRGLRTVEEVRDKTKASGSCGGCKPLVSALLAAVLNGGAGLGAKRVVPVCDCTELDQAGLRDAALSGGYETASEARAALGWRRADGCAVCRPALAYYLALRDEIGAGVAAAAAAVSAEEVNAGFAAGTRFDWEQAARTKPMPSAVQVAVSERVLAASDALVRDFGVAATPVGWEVYVGGHAGHPVKQAQLLAVETEREAAFALAAACLQYYRETGHHGERAWKWLDRVGLTPLRERLLDADRREALLARWESRRDRKERTDIAWSNA